MQGVVLTLIIASGTFGRTVSPYWCELHTGIMKYTVCVYTSIIFAVVESYELTGRHTVLAMSVSAGLTLVLLLSLVALYKSLAPIKTNSKTVNATSKFALEQESGQGNAYT